MKARWIFLILLLIGAAAYWLLRQTDPPADSEFALATELQAPASDPASLAYALSKVAQTPEHVDETHADSEPRHEHQSPVAGTSASTEPQQRARDHYRVLREGVEQREGHGRAIAILEAPERNYPMLRRERFTGPMGQTVERWMVADHVVGVLKASSAEADFKDLINQNRLSVRGTVAAERSYLIQFDGTDPLRLPQVLGILEASGLFESVDSDPVELSN